MTKHWKLLLSLAFTVAILAALYAMVDVQTLLETLRTANPGWLAVYLALFVPQLLLAGLRWKSLVYHFGGVELSFGRAFCQCLGAYAANLVVPSKMGEFVKGVWLNTGDRTFLPFFLVGLEKLFDMAATLGILTLALVVVLPAPVYQPLAVLVPILVALLAGWTVAFFLLKRARWPLKLINKLFIKGEEEALREKWVAMTGQKGSILKVGALSVALWVVQLVQFGCMFQVFGVSVPGAELFVGAPLALFAGALPLTAGGVGLRDAALLWYFGTGLSMEVVLSVGILSHLRIFLIGLVGLPFFFVQMREGKHE